MRLGLRSRDTVFRALVVAGLVVAFGLAMLGSWTRINGAGMTCPDWPLCRGAVVPMLRGAVVLEWLHRVLAACESVLVAGLVITGLRLRSAMPVLGGMVIALGTIFVLQVLLGGATIVLANSPLSVMLHWGVAMLLLAALCSLAVVAFVSEPPRTAPAFGGLRETAPLVIATGWAFVTMCAGAYVSAGGAGLACPSAPGCGDTFFGQTIPQALHMTHRILAAALVLLAVTAAIVLPRYRQRATAALRIAMILLAVQIALGLLNVFWSLPAGLREAHAATAIATFLGFVIATVFASLESGQTAARGEI